MKKNRQTHCGIGLLKAGIPVLLSGTMLASCQNKLHESYQPTDGLLRFAVNDSVQWQQGQVARSESQFGGATSVAAKVIKVNGTVKEGRQMYLVASVKEGIDATNSALGASSDVATKGTMIMDTGAASFHQSFGVFAESYRGAVPTTFTANYMDRVQVIRPADGATYSTATKYYIPAGETVKLYAYAPYDATTLVEAPPLTGAGTGEMNAGLILPESREDQHLAFSTAIPSYTYRTPRWIAGQSDLCFAEASVTSSNSRATLTFGHAMAAIRFLVSSTVEGCKINSISLNNIYSEATLTPTTEPQQGWWTYPDPAVTASFTYNNSNNGITHPDNDQGNATDIFGSGNAMFMIPHPLASNASVSIDVTAGSTRKTLTAPLTGSWTKGNTYTYTLSFSTAPDVNFNVSLTSDSTAEATGGDFTFSVTSEQNNTFVPYKVQYQDGEDWYDLNPSELKTMLSSESTSGDGTTRTHSFHTDEVFTVNSDQNIQLKKATPPSANGENEEGNPYDLTTGTTHSANCYIVSAPGWYKIPIVYGNALLVNSKSMNSKVSGKYTPFVDGYTVNTPWVNDMAPVAHCRLLWQDSEGLVRNVQQMDSHYLKFYVDSTTIAEGNAVIGAFYYSQYQETLLWSWHIWVTPGVSHVRSSTNTNIGGSLEFMNVPLGYVNGGTATWEPGIVTIRFIPQNPDNSTEYLDNLARTFTLTKKGASHPTPGRYVTYQWGRKDPMRPITTGVNGKVADCPVYPEPGGNTDYLPQNQTITSANQIDWVRNPHKFHTSESAVSAALWNSMQSIITTTSTYGVMSKGLYDPCPYMYAVPAAGAFDDLAAKGQDMQYLVSVPNLSTGDGGYSYGYSSFDLWDTNYGIGFGDGYAIFNVGGTINGAYQAYTWRLPLLGGRPAPNFTNDLYGNHGFYWMTGKPTNTTGSCLGMYLPNYGGASPWIDLIGVSPQNGTYAQFIIGDARNAYAIIPAYDAFIDQ